MYQMRITSHAPRNASWRRRIDSDLKGCSEIQIRDDLDAGIMAIREDGQTGKKTCMYSAQLLSCDPVRSKRERDR